jgi:hypothetical protein
MLNWPTKPTHKRPLKLSSSLKRQRKVSESIGKGSKSERPSSDSDTTYQSVNRK